MATEDGYYLGRRLAGLDLTDHAVVSQALAGLRGAPTRRTPRDSRRRRTSSASCSTTPRASLAPLRDTVFDHTPFLQKVIGESTPGEILKQLDEIDAAEQAFQDTVGRG